MERERGVEVWNVATTGAALGHHEGEERQARRGRLVDVQDVEVALAQPAADPRQRHRPERQPGHRAVVRDADGLPGARDAVRHRGVDPAGARTSTWCPRPLSARARSRTWAWTPPATSSEYGHTIPMRMRRPSVLTARGVPVRPWARRRRRRRSRRSPGRWAPPRAARGGYRPADHGTWADSGGRRGARSRREENAHGRPGPQGRPGSARQRGGSAPRRDRSSASRATRSEPSSRARRRRRQGRSIRKSIP